MAYHIDIDKLIAEIERYKNAAIDAYNPLGEDADFWYGKVVAYEDLKALIASLQKEQPMPDSTKLIKLWHEDKEMLKEKDFRDDQWRLAFNAFLCGFGRGIAVKQKQTVEEPTCKTCGFYENNCPFIRDKFIPYPSRVCKDYTYSVMKAQEKSESDLEKEIIRYQREDMDRDTTVRDVARHFYELGLKARKEE